MEGGTTRGLDFVQVGSAGGWGCGFIQRRGRKNVVWSATRLPNLELGVSGEFANASRNADKR
jgi:hypothetical protein